MEGRRDARAGTRDPWYVQAGQGMMATIAVASERGGYTLTDRGTFIKYEAQNKGQPAAHHPHRRGTRP